MKSNAIPSATSSETTPNEISVALMGSTHRPTSTTSAPPRGLGPAWERPDAQPAPSRIFEDNALDEIGHVLAAVGDRLEQLVDRFQLDQLAHVLFFPKELRHRRAHDPVGIGLEAVDLLAGLDRRLDHLRLADLRQQRDGVLHPLAAPRAQVAEAQDIVVHRPVSYTHLRAHGDRTRSRMPSSA